MFHEKTNHKVIIYFFILFSFINYNHSFSKENQNPFIIYFLLDDLGWKDIGFHKGINTPNINNLANNGIILEKLYTQPFSSQTHAAILTGRYPIRYGLQTFSINNNSKYGLKKDEKTIANVLSNNGYETAAFGQWRLGHYKKEYWPINKGFSNFFGLVKKKLYDSVNKENWVHNSNFVSNSTFSVDLIKSSVTKYINDYSSNNPFFLFISFPGPGSPIFLPKSFDKKEISDREKYIYMVKSIDSAIGEITKALENKIKKENILLIFHSDNGGAVKSKYPTNDGDVSVTTANNGPFRSGKGTFYEGGIRVTGIVKWSENLTPGIINSKLHVTDFFPTILDLAGIRPQNSEIVKPLDGVSFANELKTGKLTNKKEILINVNELSGSIIYDKWKLIAYNSFPSKYELYDLMDDPSEEYDRLKKNPEIFKKLLKKLNDYAWEMEDSLYFKEFPIIWSNNPEKI